jgi:MFS superfamily sulfate permease-like transporter
MVVLLFTFALVALTVVALMFAGVVAAIATGIALLNVFAMLLGLRTRRAHMRAGPSERWKPSAFRLPPEPTEDSEGHHPVLTIHRR